MAALRAVMDAARDGNGRLAVIEGSAGIGKTSLLAEVRAAAESTGLRVLSARGGELEREFAFGIVRQLFEPMVVTASPAEREDLLAGAARLAAPLFGGSALAESAGDISFAILHGLYWLAANAALSQPIMLLVDDLHWSDAPSLRWLIYIARRLEGLPLMLTVGTRPPEQSEQAVLVTELVTDPSAMVLRPGVLGPESVRILARGLFSAEPEGDFCAACCKATGGNPLYLRALLMTLAGDRVAPTAASAARVQEVGPEPVARAVSLRLSRLSPAAAALARAVAVLGTGSNCSMRLRLRRRARARRAGRRSARAIELLRPWTRVEFVHPVVRAAGLRMIDRGSNGSETHRDAAGSTDESGAPPERVASLYSRCPLLAIHCRPVLRDAADGHSHTAPRCRPDVPPPRTRGAARRDDHFDILLGARTVERWLDLPAG